MTDENYEASAQAHLASIKRDMKASMEDAVVRAMHKVMAEFEAKSDERLMEDWGPGPHEHHSLPERGPEQTAQPRAWFTVDELNAWAEKKLKENPQWAEQPAQQEPFATVYSFNDLGGVYELVSPPKYRPPVGTKLYTSPPVQRKPLTDEEIDCMYVSCKYGSVRELARAIEAAHGIKENT